MSGGFVKLYGTILDSSVWSEDPYTRLVWITLLAMADADGFVEAAVPGLARRANVPLDACKNALGRLMAPDPYSKSPENEGRRVERVDRGWIILNYKHYRELRTPEQIAAAERQARYKARKSGVIADASHGEKTAALPLPSVETKNGVPERSEEVAEAESCLRTIARHTALSGKQPDEILYDFSEYKGRRLMRLDTAPLKWLKVTHDRILADVMRLERESATRQQSGEDPLARIKRLEREGRARKGNA